jgi:hypothetical protein
MILLFSRRGRSKSSEFAALYPPSPLVSLSGRKLFGMLCVAGTAGFNPMIRKQLRLRFPFQRTYAAHEKGLQWRDLRCSPLVFLADLRLANWRGEVGQGFEIYFRRCLCGFEAVFRVLQGLTRNGGVGGLDDAGPPALGDHSCPFSPGVARGWYDGRASGPKDSKRRG